MRKAKLVLMAAVVAAAMMLSGCRVVRDGWVFEYRHGVGYMSYPEVGGPACPGVPVIPDYDVDEEWGPAMSLGPCF